MAHGQPLRWKLFGSRVARRVFVSLVVASAAPLVAVAVLSVTQVGSTLESRARDSLAAASRSYGQEVLDRLLWMSDALPAATSDNAAIGDASVLGGFTTVFSGSRLDFGLPAEAPEGGKPELLVRGTRVEPQLLLARTIDSRGTVAVGRLDPAYLWRGAALLADGMQPCVLSRGVDQPLFCADALPQSVREDLARRWEQSPAGIVQWSDEHGEWLSAYRELLVSSSFVSEPWLVVVSQRRDVALGAMAAFREIVPKVLLLSFVAVVLLAVFQARRIVEPLEQVVHGIKRYAQGNFGTRVEIAANDEFGALGTAMNAMAEKLGRQFGTLTAIAEIDQMILSSQDVETLLQSSLDSAQSLLPAAQIAILLLDRQSPQRGKLYMLDAAREGARRRVGSVEVDGIRPWPSLTSGYLSAAALADLGLPLNPSLPGAFAAPIVRDSAFAGAVFASAAEIASMHPDDCAALNELAARLAVAIAAAEREQELFARSHFDALTGLPNRQLCEDRLRQALAQVKRHGRKLAVLFIDLDGFKTVNESLGHAAGDAVLRQTAQRLRAAVRETDTVARLGGDEYAILLPHVHDALEVETVIESLMADLARPFQIRGGETYVTASVGVTIFPDDGETPEELLSKADTAMYSAKDIGRARSVFYTKEMDERAHDRVALYTDLRHAAANGELSLEYQPQVELASRRPVLVEALIRWRHPARGPIPPELFVPILEDTGLVETVGPWVLETALRDLAHMRSRGAAQMRIAVNVSARQLFSAGFAEHVIESVRAAGLQPGDLELELTESTLVTDFAAANAVLARLAAAGVRIGVDDFGTGYSSLGYLKDLTFDTLKIDRALVANLADEKSLAIVKAIVAVAHALGKEVVAEGVESEEQRSRLGELGCTRAQGFLFSTALIRDAVIAWLAEASRTAASGLTSGNARDNGRRLRRQPRS